MGTRSNSSGTDGPQAPCFINLRRCPRFTDLPEASFRSFNLRLILAFLLN